uniref:Uncharacterized protein n=1 Tax=Arundo donax TaxID=35708 RepID=A0A0A9BC50_ARUDO
MSCYLVLRIASQNFNEFKILSSLFLILQVYGEIKYHEKIAST